jgi:hypothetical protein
MRKVEFPVWVILFFRNLNALFRSNHYSQEPFEIYRYNSALTIGETIRVITESHDIYFQWLLLHFQTAIIYRESCLL